MRRAARIVEPWKEDLLALGAIDDGPVPFVQLGGPLGDGVFETSSSGAEDRKAGKAKTLQLRKKYLKRRARKAKSPSDRLKYQAALLECRGQLKVSAAKGKKKKKKSKKSRRRKRKKKSSSSGDSDVDDSSDGHSDSSSDASLFGVAPPRGMEPRGLMKIHQQRPGALYDRAVESLGRSLGVRGGAKNPESAKMWANYLTDVVQGRATDLPVGRLQEMRTIAAALAKGAGGDHKSLLDILAQRFVSLEARATGQTSIAPGLELVEDLQTGLASPGQIRIATNELNRTARHQGNIDRLRRRP